MDKLKSKILFILLTGILLCSVSAIAAADVGDTDDVFDLSNDIENVEAESIDDVPIASEDTVADNDEVLEAPSSDEVLSAEPNGTFTDLETKINGATGRLTLDRNYTYNPSTDRVSGIIITKDIILDGAGFTIDGKNSARLFNIDQYPTITLKNLNLINGKASGSDYNGEIPTPFVLGGPNAEKLYIGKFVAISDPTKDDKIELKEIQIYSIF